MIILRRIQSAIQNILLATPGVSSFFLMEDGTSTFLLENGTDKFILE